MLFHLVNIFFLFPCIVSDHSIRRKINCPFSIKSIFYEKKLEWKICKTPSHKVILVKWVGILLFRRNHVSFHETLRISPYSIRMRENTDQKKLRIRTLFTPWLFLIRIDTIKLVKDRSTNYTKKRIILRNKNNYV